MVDITDAGKDRRARAASRGPEVVPRDRRARNDVDNPGVVKLQGETWELNIWATTDELWILADIENTDWVQRGTLKLGTCAHAPVWWNELDGTVYIAVDHDDVTWDFGVTVPLATVRRLLAELGKPPEVPPPSSGPGPLRARSRENRRTSLRDDRRRCQAAQAAATARKPHSGVRRLALRCPATVVPLPHRRPTAGTRPGLQLRSS
jgi:hypothetical protein